MPSVIQKGCKDRRALVSISRYFGDLYAHSHGKKVRLEQEKSIGLAPVAGFTKWLEIQRRHAMQSLQRHQGRPLAWGEWYMCTFPDWSNLKKREKFYYEKKIVGGLDRGAAGKLVWHNKLLFNTHDLNLLLAPVYVIGRQVGPRRDREHSEFGRLRRVSDRAVERLNRRRRALGIPLITTMPEVQARKRAKKKRQTLAEILADSYEFVSFLNSPNYPGVTKKGLKEAIIEGLHSSGNTIKITKWAPNWVATIKTPELTQPQKFSMVLIASEAIQLRRQCRLAQPLPAKPVPVIAAAAQPPLNSKPSNPVPAMAAAPETPAASKTPAIQPQKTFAPASAAPVQQPASPAAAPTSTVASIPPGPLTAPFVIAQMLFHSQTSQFLIRDLNDLQQRLQQGGFSSQRTPDRQLHITDTAGRQLNLDCNNFVIQCQRHVLLKTLEVFVMIPTQPPDFAAFNASHQQTACWKLPPFGEFWAEAQKVCSDKEVSLRWEKAVKATAKIHGAQERGRQLRFQLKKRRLTPWETFVLLQAHCGESEFLAEWLLGKQVEESYKFRAIEDFLISTGYEPPSNAINPTSVFVR